MARMLQALKNLEARSPAKPAAKATAPRPAPEVAPAAPKPAPAAINLSIPQVTESLDALASNLASLETPIGDRPGKFDVAGADRPLTVSANPRPFVFPIAAPVSSAPAPTSPAPPLPTATRDSCEIERLVRRTLSDVVRSKPLKELADRLRRDLEQTAGKTSALVGVGQQSATHEALIYVATLLAEEGNGKVLLVDADFVGRRLSLALEYEQERGLSELLGEENSAELACRPTSIDKLMFLPAGVSKAPDLSVMAPRCGRILEQFGQQFDHVLIDAGRTNDPAASTLARMANATYLVVQLGTVETSEAQAALADFRSVGARVLGCIAT